MSFFSSQPAKIVKFTDSESLVSPNKEKNQPDGLDKKCAKASPELENHDLPKNLSDSVDQTSVGNELVSVILPDCWNWEQKEQFCLKNKWLIMKNKKLGCNSCKTVGSLGPETTSQGMTLSKEWMEVRISPFGIDKSKQRDHYERKYMNIKILHLR